MTRRVGRALAPLLSVSLAQITNSPLTDNVSPLVPRTHSNPPNHASPAIRIAQLAPAAHSRSALLARHPTPFSPMVVVSQRAVKINSSTHRAQVVRNAIRAVQAVRDLVRIHVLHVRTPDRFCREALVCRRIVPTRRVL